ncbi:MAG TPA: DPP IV N-terminal domain-containing protein [Gemmatimonadaceae bacterium]|nr:DPP IV N-terminal domain-containing protein [Gemmatimonadaceae bacterium]
MHTRHLFSLLLLAAPALAQSPRAYTAQDYARAERFLAPNTVPLVTGLGVQPTFIDNGRFWYRTTSANGFSFIMVDPAKRTRSSAFDQARLAQALSAAANGHFDANRLPFQTFELDKNGRLLVVEAQQRRWRCDMQAYQCSSMDTTGAAIATPPANSVVSPDGRRAAFIRDYNLWMKDLGTGRETQLTTDGVKDYGYATNNAGWVRRPTPVLAWSPDSRKIATFQQDERGTSMMYLVSTNVGEPRLQAWHYPLPGDSVIFRISRVIIDADPAGGGAPRVVRFQMPPDEHRSTICDDISCNGDFTDVEWYPDGSALAFVSVSRDHKDVTLRVADAGTGAVRDVLHEHANTQFESGISPVGNTNWRVIPATNEVLWWSQRSDWGHLYLYDLRTGQLKRAVTSGNWNVADVLRVDEKARQLIITGVGREPGRDPYFQHVYKVGMDNGSVTLLTPENANHNATIAPDGRMFVDTYSTPTTPPVTVLRDVNGRLLLTLEQGDASRLLATGWHPPTPIVVKARDGKTDLYGLMFTPSNLDSTKKYPIINHIYPGPQTGSVATRNFAPARGDDQSLAELGFVVVEIDGMGTPWRSKSFQDAYYGRMGDNTLPDQVDGMRQLAQRYQFIDIDRAAIWGHSGGGFATADAMFRYPDFFKVGISESGNHDNRNYEDDWGERYQGLLERHGPNDNYTAEANQSIVKNLKGKLLLAHGGVDDNVPPYNTYLVADELIKANKDFDLLVLPNQRHGYGSQSNYMMRRRWDYFVRNLLGAEPPREYEIGRKPTP